MYPALILTFVVLAFSAFTAHRNPATWALFWIFLAGFMLQGGFLFIVAFRGGQLERRERKLGYSTWARKR